MPARTHRTPAHAKRALLWTVGLYVAAQLTFSLLLDYRWPFLRFPSAHARLGELAKSQIKPDIVLLGSSRFEAGIVPAEIAWQLDRQCSLDHPVGVFKGGISCGDPIVFEFMFNRLLEAGHHPRLLVLEISPETLNRNNQWLGMHVRRQLRWGDVPRYFLDICRADQAMRWLGERINPLFIHREELWKKAAEALEQSSAQSAAEAAPWTLASTKPHSAAESDGASISDPLLPAAPLLSPEAAAMSLCGAQLPEKWLRYYGIHGSATADALERVLRQCQEQRIEVLLVGVPVTQPHRATYTSDIDREYFAYIATLTDKFGCRFVDYRDRFPDSLFTDNHHLSPVGGFSFSRLLAFEQLAPFFQAQGMGRDVRTANLR
jgi:hypothetical protein